MCWLSGAFKHSTTACRTHTYHTRGGLWMLEKPNRIRAKRVRKRATADHLPKWPRVAREPERKPNHVPLVCNVWRPGVGCKANQKGTTDGRSSLVRFHKIASCSQSEPYCATLSTWTQTKPRPIGMSGAKRTKRVPQDGRSSLVRFHKIASCSQSEPYCATLSTWTQTKPRPIGMQRVAPRIRVQSEPKGYHRRSSLVRFPQNRLMFAKRTTLGWFHTAWHSTVRFASTSA